MELLDLSVIQIDIPNSRAALEEIHRANLVITALSLDEEMKGFELALRVKQSAPDTSVIILADVDDPDELDEETALESPFVYLSRPVDIHQFLRVVVAGLEGHEAMQQALRTPAAVTTTQPQDMGPVPSLDAEAAKTILDGLQTDLGAMAIILATRSGEPLLETGATGFINREDLARTMTPIMHTSIGVRDLVGGQVSTVQFYDGEEYDIFVLSVGLHHFISVIFDGHSGARQFGLVNRFGRRAVEDLIGLIGADAFFIMPPQPKEELPKRPHPAKPKATEPDEPVELARAEINFADANGGPEPEETTLEPAQPIENLDLDELFGSDEATLDESMFDIDNLEQLAKESSQTRKGALSREEARELGLID